MFVRKYTVVYLTERKTECLSVYYRNMQEQFNKRRKVDREEGEEEEKKKRTKRKQNGD